MLTDAQDRLQRHAREFSYRARYLVNAYPAVYMPVGRVRHRGRAEYLVTRDTELVIEGCGRAGSTFALFAFRSAQERPVRTAHHTHAAAQVLTAARWRIPTLVIVPRAARLGPLPHGPAQHLRPAGAAVVAALPQPHPARPGPVSSRSAFEQVTSDFGAVIERVNAAFGTDFGVFQHTPENEAAVLAAIERRTGSAGATR